MNNKKTGGLIGSTRVNLRVWLACWLLGTASLAGAQTPVSKPSPVKQAALNQNQAPDASSAPVANHDLPAGAGESAVPRRDDEVTRIMQEAEQAYQHGQYVKAGRLLQQAVNIVADLQQEQLSSLFPSPSEGWQQVEVDAQSPDSMANALQMLGGIAQVKRYQAIQQPEQSIQLALLNNPPRLLNNFLDLVQMTGLGDGAKQNVSIDKYTASLQCSPARGCHVILQLDNQMLLLAHGTNVSGELLLTYLRGFRFAGLAEH